MNDLNIVLAAVTDAQYRATVGVMLPVIMHGPFYSEAAVLEWHSFKPLADAFAAQFSPATAYARPLQFINWVAAHKEIKGTQEYLMHIADCASNRANDTKNELAKVPSLDAAEKALNEAGLIVPRHKIINN